VIQPENVAVDQYCALSSGEGAPCFIKIEKRILPEARGRYLAVFASGRTEKRVTLLSSSQVRCASHGE
jgi:hypothetical protein